MSSSILSEEDKAVVNKHLTKETSSLASSIARLYVAISKNGSPREWTYTGFMGIVCFVIDRRLGLKLIRLYALSTDSGNGSPLRAQFEIPFDGDYEAETESFHSFEIDGNLYGLSFALSREENEDGDATKGNHVRGSEAKKFLSVVQNNKPTTEEEEMVKATLPNGDGKRRPSVWKKTVGKLFGSNPTNTPVVQKPTEFKHNFHMGFTANGEMSNWGDFDLTDEWKTIFKEAGIKKKELKNPEVQKIIMDTMNAHSRISMKPPAGSSTSTPAGTRPAPPRPTPRAPPSAGSSTPQQQQQEEEIMSTPKSAPPPRRRAASNASTTPAGAAATPASGTPRKRVRAKYKLLPKDPANPKYLSFEVGEEFSVITVLGDGWIRVTNKDGKTGLVPKNYVEDIVPGGQQAPPSASVRVARSAGSSSPKRSNQPPPAPVASTTGQQPPSAAASSAPEPTSAPPPPMNPLLAGIQGFNKEKLKASDSVDSSSRPDSSGGASGGGSILGDISSGKFQLKKASERALPAAPEKSVDPEVTGIAGILAAKLAQVRMAVNDDGPVEDDDDDDDWDDWDD